MDRFEKQLCAHDKANAQDKRMDKTIKQANKEMRDEAKYIRMYKEKVIEMRM